MIPRPTSGPQKGVQSLHRNIPGKCVILQYKYLLIVLNAKLLKTLTTKPILGPIKGFKAQHGNIHKCT